MLKNILSLLIYFLPAFGFAQISTRLTEKPDSIAIHKVVLDKHLKIIPWTMPAGKAYDGFLRLRWNFIKKKAPLSPGPAPRSRYPQYYFYCAFRDSNDILLPDLWMNDVGEKIPNWFESARLYYAYSGDMGPLNITKGMADYALTHGLTPSNYSWPNFPQTASNAGDTEFRGFSSAKRFSTDDVQVDHAGDMGATFYKMFLLYGNTRYKTAAVNVANVLAGKLRRGNAIQSPWPYVVNMKTGKIVSDYGANWFGCITLFDMLIDANIGEVKAYREARATVQEWILQYPMKNGLWVDGHTDNYITGTANLSNMSASNAGLYLADHPEFDPEFRIDLPGLIKWTEENFILRSARGEPCTQWGANIVGEQVSFPYKMDYQTARYAAQCARWYAISGDTSFKEKAYRCLNWITYCIDTTGRAFESPLSNGILSWWSDSYGECPRMFYHAFAAIPEWTPPGENHILYSDGILNNISYLPRQIQYLATGKTGKEYLHLAFKPVKITVNDIEIFLRADLTKNGYTLKALGNGNYAVTVNRPSAGKVVIAGFH